MNTAEQLQFTYETVPGDSLPLIAELCGHSGEWMAIMDSAPFLWNLDWNNIQPGMNILLPPGWQMGGGEIEVLKEESTTISTEKGTSSDEEIALRY